jgi:nucleoside-diphosphate-sugar epimerase
LHFESDKRILITGGAGLMGSHIAKQAARKGTKEIVVLDNFVRGRREKLKQESGRKRDCKNSWSGGKRDASP